MAYEGKLVSVTDMAMEREARVASRAELLSKYPGRTVLTLTMNIPGPRKSGADFYRAFCIGRNAAEEAMASRSVRVFSKKTRRNRAGYTAFYVTDGRADELKHIMMDVEQKHPLGRLFDLDVTAENGENVSRNDFGNPPRRCFICGRDAKECGRNRTHSAQELASAVERMIQNYTASAIANAASDAMTMEVETAPKPGLVDPITPGAHKDMDIHTFRASIRAITPFFEEMAFAGLSHKGRPRELFPKLREIGLHAEKAMFSVTGGVNTHKGAIFSIGLLCAAAGLQLSNQGCVAAEEITSMASQIVAPEMEQEWNDISNRSKHTKGELLFLQHGNRGIRGEAADGYPSVLAVLPGFKEESASGAGKNEVKLQTLFRLMTISEDTNVLARCGENGLQWMKETAKRILEAGGAYSARGMTLIAGLDSDFTKRNMSPGGCADLLSAVLLLDQLEKIPWLKG
jgi:holo-ACP synthase/triphosphoribosyl-dephospho-CoA synthase